eukprot:TRINITY_DN7758_c2_g1_i1.p1 TRINITY_DN7758_c2_g1~~TRINITY_DN7758_c2_g1_i1.p1  ORF type:complete len:513 (+),score=74.16 TRINITY_DN7758_c2_g1_i1:82-1539(+)
MAGFSAGIKFNSLDDYILPSQACVLPVEDDFSKGTVAINKKESTAAKSVELSLADCLACSGCVTTAETMLVQEQSGEKLKNLIANKKGKKLLATISPQSVSSIAAHFSEDGPAAMSRIHSFLTTHMSFDFVTDLAWAQIATLQETLSEFHSTPKDSLPIITSSCPGLVCLAEKSQPSILPHLSKVQSAQQIAGRVLKQGFPDLLGDPENILHVSVQPCFDKKLEATRKEFATPTGGRFTDMVLATTELLDLFTEYKARTPDPSQSQRPVLKLKSNIPRLASSSPSLPMYQNLEGSGSQCLTVLANHLSNVHNVIITQEHVTLKPGETTAVTRPSAGMELHLSNKKPGAYEFTVIDSLTGKTTFRAAALYGFKHITNLVKTTRIKKVPDFKKYDFIELMACPDGCLNGGGQLRSTTLSGTALLRAVTVAHDSLVNFQSSVEGEGHSVHDIFIKSGGDASDWFYTKFNNLSKESDDKKQPTLAQLDW